MAELKNTFSWSFSAAEDFNECRRRRYWAKYAMWGGWAADATPEQKAAYRLSKMESLATIKGNAVERAVMWVLRRKQQGKDSTVEEAYAAEARPYLNGCWLDSTKGLWKDNPKKHCCLFEHYYGRIDAASGREAASRLAALAKLCIGNFIAKVLPRLANVKPEDEIKIATSRNGDPESFLFPFDGEFCAKIYAIPDYAYCHDGEMQIHDWKSGKPSPRHANQMALYALWANTRYKFDPAKTKTHIEYLAAGETVSMSVTQAQLEAVSEQIRASIEEMREYLKDGDLERNEPLQKEDWELAADQNTCRRCNFYELCKPELEADT